MNSFWSKMAGLAILLLAVATRFYRLGYQSLWSDEGNSLSLARAGFGEIAVRTAFDIHPPFYYWLLKIWVSLFGESEFGLRSLSATLGVLLVGLIYGLGRKWFGTQVGRAAALVAALAPFQVYYAQEARMYMLLTLLGAACIWLAVEVWPDHFKPYIPRQSQRSQTTLTQISNQASIPPAWRPGVMVGYIILATFGLYTHYVFPLILLAINLVVAPNLWPSKRRLGLWMGAQVIPLLLYLPWLPTAFRQITTWPSLVEPAAAGEIGLTLLRLLSLGTAAAAVSNLWISLFVGLALLGMAAAIWPRRGQRQPISLLLLTLLWLLLPAGLTAALFRPAYLKIFLLASPAFCLLVGLGIAHLAAWPAPGQKNLPFLALLLIAISGYLALDVYYTNPDFQRDNYRGIAAFISAVATKEDAIIIHAPGQQEVFRYYYHPEAGQPPVYPLPRRRPLDPIETIKELETLAAQARQIYGIYWGTEEADPEGLIENWLDQHAFKAHDAWFGNVRLVSYASPSWQPEVQELNIRLGEQIWLRGYGFSEGKVAPGEILQVSLAWETDSPLIKDYTVFVQLLDEANHIVGQRDAWPLTPTTAWPPGQMVVDRHGLYLEPGTPPTPLRLIAGLYDAATGARVPVEGGGDFVELGSILAAKNPSPLPVEAFQMQYHLAEPPLSGYDLYKLGHAANSDTPLRSGDPLHLNLYWQKPARLPEQDRVDLRLVDKKGKVVASWQQPVAGVNYPMAHWSEEEIMRAQYDLFLTNVPPGSYQFEIALSGKTVGKTHWFVIEK